MGEFMTHKSGQMWPAPYEHKEVQRQYYRVLLVEDEPIDQLAFRRFVRNAGHPYDCTIVGSASEAKAVLRGAPLFDVIVSDYQLGDGTVFDVLELVKETPVILVTGAGGEETAVRAWRTGIYDYLVKDGRGDYLHALPITIENAVAHQRAKKQLELLSGAIMHAGDCIYVTDLQGRIVFVNNAFCNTYGYQRDDVLGKDSSILWTGEHSSSPTGCVLGIPTAGGKTAIGFYHKRRDGRMFPVSLSRSIIKDSHAHDVAVVGIARDLSDHLSLVDEFDAQVKSLTEHNQRCKELTVATMETMSALLESGDIDGALGIIGGFREALETEERESRLECT